MRRFAVLALLAAAATSAAAQTAAVLQQGRFGALALRTPRSAPAGMVLLLDDSPSAASLAASLAARGLVVAELNTAHYLAELRRKAGGCNYLAADLEDLAHRVGREASLGQYLSPVLIGTGEGAVLVQAALRQAPAGTFAGGLGLRASGDVELGSAPLCAGPHGALKPAADAPTRYADDPAAARDAGYVALAEVGQAGEAASRLLAAARPAPPPDTPADVSDLAAVVLAVPAPSTTLVLMISGDGGWAGIDKEVGAQLVSRGLPVIGVSSLAYFWQRRTPDEAAADMARLLRHYLARWQASRIILVGYSFGADVLPFIVNRLPPDLRARIASLNLLALGQKADFEVHVTGWIGGVGREALPIAPELARTADLPRLCFYGAGDRDSTAACAAVTGARSAAREVGQGHHFGYQYAQIAEQILQFAGR